MEINNTLFQALLRQQNISEFRVIRFASESIGKLMCKYIKLDNIYAYIKDNVFHICNDQFVDIKISDINFLEKGIHQIGYNDKEYTYPYKENENSMVIDSDGKIIYKDPKDFCYIGTNEFLEDKPLFIDEYGKGLLYDCLNKNFITPLSYDFLTGYKINNDFNTPKIDNKKFIVNGVQYKESKYLFSFKKGYIHSPHIFSYFENSDENLISFYGSSMYGTERIVLNPRCLWYSGWDVFAITFTLLNQIDSEGNIILPFDLCTSHISFEIKVYGGDSFGVVSSAILEYYGSLKDKSDLEYFYRNLKIFPTKSSLLLLYSDDGLGNHNFFDHYAIVVSDIGKISLCKHLEYAQVFLSENNILCLKRYGEEEMDYCDIFGNVLCTAHCSNPKPQIFSRGLTMPITFNDSEILIRNSTYCKHFFRDGEYAQFYGVIELQSGKVLVPPCYSKIRLKEIDYYDDYEHESGLLSIVQINNFF